MKKVIALILALAMVFALAACGGSTSAAPAAEAKTPAEPVVLTFAAETSRSARPSAKQRRSLRRSPAAP